MPLYGSFARALPNLAAGRYFQTTSPATTGTSATAGVGTLRLSPWVVTQALSIDRIGAEVTVVGDAGSKVRLGIYADNGNLYPGTLVLDAGQIAGDSATVQELTVSQVLAAGVYWIGGAVQSVTTTQPTLRVNATWTPPVPTAGSTTTPASNAAFTGYSQSSVTGALPSTFSTSLSATGTVVRVFVRTA
jgi:hypothetical protein